MMKLNTSSVILCIIGLIFTAEATYLKEGLPLPPVEWQAQDAEKRLASPDASVRAGAVEQLGFMRDYSRADIVTAALSDPDAAVRREAAMALGWLGNRDSLKPLVDALGDSDWTVRQSAAIALENLTAKKLPFDALAGTELLKRKQKEWADSIARFDSSKLLKGCRKMVAAPSRIHEAEEADFEGGVAIGSGRNASGNRFADYTANTNATIRWTISLPKGGLKPIALRYSLPAPSRPLKLSVNGTVVEQALDFPPTSDWETWDWITVPTRLKRGNNTIELTTIGNSGGNFDCLMVADKNADPQEIFSAESRMVSSEKYFDRADTLRAIDTMNIDAAVPLIIDALQPYLGGRYPGDNRTYLYTPKSPASDARPERAFVQEGLRTLGRLGGAKAEAFLIEMMQTNKNWACYAAEALGDCGNEEAVEALINQIPKTSFKTDLPGSFNNYNGIVEVFPEHDAPKLSAGDRIPRTSYEALLALSRLDLSKHKEELRAVSPYILSTIPSTFDATVMYAEEPWAMLYGYMLEQAGVREQAVDAAFTALDVSGRGLPDSFELKDDFIKLMQRNLNRHVSARPPFAGLLLMLAADKKDIPDLLSLLDHKAGWIKIDVARALMYLEAKEAVDPLIRALESAKDDADYGYGMDFRRFGSNYREQKRLPGAGYDEFNDPSPRYKEAFVRALGRLGGSKAVPVLIEYLNNDRNAIEIQVAAEIALDEVGTPAALRALKTAEVDHPVAVVQVMAREALWRHKVAQKQVPDPVKQTFIKQLPVPEGLPEELVFIKGEREPGNNEQFSADMTAYSTTDGGPTYRYGKNIFRLKTTDPANSLKQLTHFETGYLSDLEVSYDGTKLLFSRNTMAPEPWLHVFEMNADGTGLKQLTAGPYHDVHPNYMPDGRIVFTTTRTGIRDEYHGYPANGLATMNADGSNIQVIGYNIGRDAEPVIGEDGKILFTRLELFYSRMKTEWNLLSVFPDGVKPVTLYGPERRRQHVFIPGADAIAPPRHRGLRITQPQSWVSAEYLVNTFKGPMIAGPGRNKETFLNPENEWAITTPYKIDDTTLLVAAGERPLITTNSLLYKRALKREKDPPKLGSVDYFASVDHGLYWMNIETGKKTLIYNDPEMADFEARPLQPRNVPPILPTSPLTRSRAFSGSLYCSSAFITQDPHVKERGKYIRVVEGIPTITRHQSHMNGGIAWRNHGGAVGRVLGTVPLAADGSFSLELPSDRLFHCQILDSDRRVVGNELIWQYVRPKEIKGCVGCHENPDGAPSMPSAFPLAQQSAPVKCFPHGDEMQYHAKMWFKGWAPDEREERMRTVNSVNIFGRN